MVAAGGIGFVRHEGGIRSIETGRPLRHPAHPCNIYGRPPPCKRFLQRCDLESRLLPSIRPVDAAPQAAGPDEIRGSTPNHAVELCRSLLHTGLADPGPTCHVITSSSRPRKPKESLMCRPRRRDGCRAAALSHPVLSPDANLFVRSAGPPLRPDLSFPGAPRAADGKAGPPGPPPEAAWPCRSEHGAILPRVGIADAEGAWSSPPHPCAGSAAASGLR